MRSSNAGTIHAIVTFLEERWSAFAVSRLIMLSGVNVRSFTPQSHDDPEALRKVEAALTQMLSADEMEALRRRLGR